MRVKPNFTPGPWKYNAAYRSITGHRPESDLPMVVAEVFLPIHNGPEYALLTANACLIAAAPEMYEALRLIIDTADTGTTMRGYHKRIEQARAALRKAEGGDA